VLAEDLHSQAVMVPFPSVSVLAGRFLEPLTRPWAAFGGGLLGGGALFSDAIAQGARLAWRLLSLLLTL
jgi:hypothetical protein